MKNFPPPHQILLAASFLLTTLAVAQPKKIYLQPKATATENQSRFVDSIRFIPLEAKAGIEVEGYSNVEEAGNYFMITDYSNKTALLYRKNGTYAGKVSYKKLGGDFSPSYDGRRNRLVFFGPNKNYDLTPRDELKIKLGWNDPRNKKYFKKYTVDLADTAFLLRKDTPDEHDINGANHYHGDVYWRGEIETSPLYKDSLGYEISIYKNNRLWKAFFPYNRVAETRFLFESENANLIRSDVPGVGFVIRPYCDTVYRMEGDSLFTAYTIVLPLENSLPASFFTKPFDNKTERENFRRNNAWMFHQVYEFYETKQFYFLAVGYLSNYETYICLKQPAATYNTKRIKSDTSQYNLSLMGGYGTSRVGNLFYKTVKAGDLSAFFAEHKAVAVPKELETFLAGKPPAASPVIVEFKLKN